MSDRDIKADMAELLKNEVAQRHSFFQLKYFLIGKEPTYQSKMWQCLRELKTRSDSMEALALEREEVKDKLELLDIAVLKSQRSEPASELEAREMQVHSRQLARQRVALQKTLADLDERERWLGEECTFFVETFRSIERIEPLRPFDDIEAQGSYWNERLTQKANLKMLTQNSIDPELVETIIALPENLPIRKDTLQKLNVRHKLLLDQLHDGLAKMGLKRGEEG